MSTKIRKSSRNRVLVPEAANALEKMKVEVANEIGISDYEHIDKGELTSRQNGYIGGNMVRKMIQFAEENMKNR